MSLSVSLISQEITYARSMRVQLIARIDCFNLYGDINLRRQPIAIDVQHARNQTSFRTHCTPVDFIKIAINIICAIKLNGEQ